MFLREVHARAGELLDTHRLAEQVALDLIEIHLVRGEEICARLDSLRNNLRTGVVCELDDTPAHRLLQALIRATGDVLMVNLQLDERKIRQSQQGGPIRADIVDRDADIVQANAPGDIASCVGKYPIPNSMRPSLGPALPARMARRRRRTAGSHPR